MIQMFPVFEKVAIKEGFRPGSLSALTTDGISQTWSFYETHTVHRLVAIATNYLGFG